MSHAQEPKKRAFSVPISVWSPQKKSYIKQYLRQNPLA